MAPQTHYQIVRKSKLKAFAQGAKRADFIFSPETVANMQILLDNGYAPNLAQAVAKALADAAKPYKKEG